jgi:4-amino-4-deoxy-L-arabinose transferase-like glycosyltransferase
MPKSRFNVQYVWMIVLLLLMWKLLLLFGDSPYFGHHDANGVWLGAAARNLRLYDIGQIGLVPQLSRGPVPPDTTNYYVHHPPLLVWVTALAESAWGEHELSMRMVSIFSTMIGIAAFFVFCRRLYGARMGLLTTGLYALTPMIIYFGRMPNHEPLALAFLMLFLAEYVNWTRAPSRKSWLILAALAFLGIWTAWADFFFVMLVAFTGLWAVRRTQRAALVGLGGVSVLAIVTIVGLYMLEYPNTIKDLIDTFNWRTSVVSEISTTFTWPEFAGQILIHLLADATFAIVIMAVPGVIRLWRDARPLNRTLLIALLAAGLSYNILFRSASYVHDYYTIFLLPFLAIAAAHGVMSAFTDPRWKRIVRPAVTGIFLTSTIAAIFFMSRWYNTNYQPLELQLAHWLAANTQPQDLILTNLPDDPPIEYYAFRKIIGNVPPDSDKSAFIPAGVQAVVYLDCPWYGAVPEQTLSDAQRLAACQIQKP